MVSFLSLKEVNAASIIPPGASWHKAGSDDAIFKMKRDQNTEIIQGLNAHYKNVQKNKVTQRLYANIAYGIKTRAIQDSIVKRTLGTK